MKAAATAAAAQAVQQGGDDASWDWKDASKLSVVAVAGQPETPEILSTAVTQLGEAVSLIPAEESSAYMTALRKYPHLIRTESDPARFLRCENFNIWAAARRLVEYWKLRLEVFGPEHCYRPVLDLSEKGALCPTVVRFIEMGTGYLLPPDQQGRIVLMYECSNTKKINTAMGLTPQHRIRHLFYCLQLVAQTEMAATIGFVMIQMIFEKQHKPSPKTYAFFSRAAKDCFPTVLREMHILLAPPITNMKKKLMFSEKLMPFMWQMLQTSCSFARRSLNFIESGTDTIAATPKSESIAAVLTNKCGLRREALPASAGGHWTYELSKLSLQAPSSSSLLAPNSPLDILAAAAHETL